MFRKRMDGVCFFYKNYHDGKRGLLSVCVFSPEYFMNDVKLDYPFVDYNWL